MSIGVEFSALREAIEQHVRAPYLLTVSDDGRAHSVAVSVEWHDDELEAAVGNRTLANAGARPAVSLLWPPDEPGGYSLIVDADVTSTSGTGAGDNVVCVRPTRAVLHRPATADTPVKDGCTDDCVPLLDLPVTE